MVESGDMYKYTKTAVGYVIVARDRKKKDKILQTNGRPFGVFGRIEQEQEQEESQPEARNKYGEEDGD